MGNLYYHFLMENLESDKWYVKLQGKTVGPLSSSELNEGLKNHSFQIDDSALCSSEKKWRPIKTFTNFAAACAERTAKNRVIKGPPPISALLAKRNEKRQTSIPTPQPMPIVQTQKLPDRPSLNSFEVDTSITKKEVPRRQALALAQMMQELRDQQETESAVLAELNREPLKTHIELNIKITKSKLFMAFFLVAFAIAAFFITRGLKDFHLSDPSSPTLKHSVDSDPIYQPKAPVRPKRN